MCVRMTPRKRMRRPTRSAQHSSALSDHSNRPESEAGLEAFFALLYKVLDMNRQSSGILIHAALSQAAAKTNTRDRVEHRVAEYRLECYRSTASRVRV